MKNDEILEYLGVKNNIQYNVLNQWISILNSKYLA